MYYNDLLTLFLPYNVYGFKRSDLTNQRVKKRQCTNLRMRVFFQELNVHKQEMMQLEHERGNRNNLLEYLRSLDPNMVIPHNFCLIYISLQLKKWYFFESFHVSLTGD